MVGCKGKRRIRPEAVTKQGGASIAGACTGGTFQAAWTSVCGWPTAVPLHYTQPPPAPALFTSGARVQVPGEGRAHN